MVVGVLRASCLSFEECDELEAVWRGVFSGKFENPRGTPCVAFYGKGLSRPKVHMFEVMGPQGGEVSQLPAYLVHCVQPAYRLHHNHVLCVDRKRPGVTCELLVTSP